MNDHQNNQHNRLSIGFIGGIIAAILATGTVATWWAVHNLKTSPDVTTNPTENPVSQDPKKIERGQVYWITDQDNRLKLLTSTLSVPKSSEDQQILETAFKTLLAGSKDSKYTTTIPQGTKLLSVNLDKEGVQINLSQEFTTGGGSASMMGRLAQVLYTATSLDNQGKVWLKIDGEPLEILGGEGLEVAQPMTRKWFEENYEL
ncbi:MAG TPA: spore germination protein [Cyanothece sp. UBA12306]|nr:spore germination protein [Cyanothece sp. UBA12306]